MESFFWYHFCRTDSNDDPTTDNKSGFISLAAILSILFQFLIDYAVPVQSKEATFYAVKVLLNAIILSIIIPIVFVLCVQKLSEHILHYLKGFKTLGNQVEPECF